MSLLPNYIYRYILESIITYLYSSYNSVFRHSNDQILTLAIVNKLWFKYVGELLSNQLTIENLYYDDYLKKLIETQQKPFQNQQNYKLIKKNQITKIFDDIESVNNNNYNNFSNNCFKRIIIKSKLFSTEESNEFLQLLETSQDNYEYIIEASPEMYIETMAKSKCLDRELSRIKVSLKKRIFSQIDNSVYSKQDCITLLFNKYIPREITCAGSYDFFFFIKLRFESSLSQPITANHYLFPPPSSLVKEEIEAAEEEKALKPRSSNLRAFNFTTNIIELIESTSYSTLLTKDEEKWNYIVSKLSNDSTLRSFAFCYHHFCQYHTLEESLFNSGLKSIISNPSLISFEYTIDHNLSLPSGIIEGLCESKSIQNLVIFDYNDKNLIFQNILLKNNSIRNIYIESPKFENDVKWLEYLKLDNTQSKPINNIFSITFSFQIFNNDFERFNKLIDYVKSNIFSVKEFNFFNNYQIKDCIKIHNQIIINDTIINIINNKK